MKMKSTLVYVVRRVYQAKDSARFVWLMDTCAGGDWSTDWSDAKEWHSRDGLMAELVGAELAGDFEIVEIVRVQGG